MALNLPATRDLLKGIIRDAYAITSKADDACVQSYAIIDEVNDTYAIMAVGWDWTGRVLGPILYFRIYNGKLWVEANNTDLEFIEERVSAAIANEDIVLGFILPEEREYSEYAVV
jgi:hypothetical protein